MAAKRWGGCPLEADYFGEDRKHGKQERKRAVAKDRSQYKKSDRDQQEKVAQRTPQVEVDPHLLRGRVLSITPQGFLVENEGQRYTCGLRGLLKKDKSQFKNLVAVGDFVRFVPLGSDEGQIASVEARQSVLSRADNLSRRKEQLIAANIDQVLITVSLLHPPLKPYLVDRYIIAAKKGRMTPVIVVNKLDLLEQAPVEEQELYAQFKEAYPKAGVPVIAISVVTGEGLEQLQAVMQGKASVFSGQSGVGKSSLINAVTGSALKTREIVEKTYKGAHTTTTATLLPLVFGGWCIDTPGIKSFGVWDLKPDEIEPYFDEIHTCGKRCKYPSCTHQEEPDCAVRTAVEAGEIATVRYLSYLYLMNSSRQEHLRR